MNSIENLNNIFAAFKISAVCKAFTEYKSACFYDIELKPGSRLRDILKYTTELSLALKTPTAPRCKILSDQGIVRLEVIKQEHAAAHLIDLGSRTPRPDGKLMCLLGETLAGDPLWIDLMDDPHLLVAGCTGSGKSTILHSLIANLLLYPDIRLFLMDPKSIEFYKYANIIGRDINIAYTYTECLETIQYLINEMERRYSKLKETGFYSNQSPYIVLIIDEYADLIMQDTDNQLKKALCKLSQKSRAAGIHIVIATQRPAANVVDGNIKANFPARISCKVATGSNSRIILDTTGAEQLSGKGDALIRNSKYELERFQAAYITPDDVISYFNR